MTYVVKAMCYLDSNGNGVASLQEATYYESEEMAQLVAKISGGRVVKLLTPTKNSKPVKANQAWLRKIKRNE
ncbi:hypothetical protein P0E66_12995 [Enterococcus faecalis]|uniref:hypothetical protein n=1 Tax=Enterococcus faecalis TaxID=1351 RepID=UPI0025B0DF78|nr:hypothetical protein [Enterococcus faecalis]MDN3202044.1 hypothetical protein [Enterococcus faecalis]